MRPPPLPSPPLLVQFVDNNHEIQRLEDTEHTSIIFTVIVTFSTAPCPSGGNVQKGYPNRGILPCYISSLETYELLIISSVGRACFLFDRYEKTVLCWPFLTLLIYTNPRENTQIAKRTSPYAPETYQPAVSNCFKAFCPCISLLFIIHDWSLQSQSMFGRNKA